MYSCMYVHIHTGNYGCMYRHGYGYVCKYMYEEYECACVSICVCARVCVHR